MGNKVNLTLSDHTWSLQIFSSTHIFQLFSKLPLFIKLFPSQSPEKLGPRIHKCIPILKRKKEEERKENYLRGKINKNCVWIGDGNNKYPLAVGMFELCISILKLNVRFWMNIMECGTNKHINQLTWGCLSNSTNVLIRGLRMQMR